MKYLIILFLSSYTAIPQLESYSEIEPTVIQMEAFEILTNKCNVCHKTQNPNKVFTLENMNGLSTKINRQVFKWKRMPKGNKTKLNAEEKEILQKWIKTIKK